LSGLCWANMWRMWKNIPLQHYFGLCKNAEQNSIGNSNVRDCSYI